MARSDTDLWWYRAKVLSRDPYGQLLVQWEQSPMADNGEKGKLLTKTKKRPLTNLAHGDPTAGNPPSSSLECSHRSHCILHDAFHTATL